MKPYPYQETAIDFMTDLEAVLCADEMGLGKTVETVFTCQAVDAQKVLVVCPNSVKGVWEEHFNKIIPDIKTIVLDNKKRKDSWQLANELLTQATRATSGCVFIIHYEAARILYKEDPTFKQAFWDVMIVDECHRLSNRKTQQTKAIFRLGRRATRRIALSGTPMDGEPWRLWSILHWLYPETFTSYWNFYNTFCDSEFMGNYHKFKGPKNIDILKDKILSKCMIRRTKDVALPDLPSKYTENVHLDMTPEQQKAHDQMSKEMVAWLGRDEDDMLMAPVVVAQLTRLRQFATAYCQTEGTFGEDDFKVQMVNPSNKLDALLEICAGTNGKKFVVFSQFKQMIKLLEQQLSNEYGPDSYVSLTGDTPAKLRPSIIKRFQQVTNTQQQPLTNNDPKFFLATIQAGGEGITLTAADTVIFLDRSWSPKDNLQAEDRLHRAGQKNAVQVINLLSKNSVDSYVDSVIQRKKSWMLDIIQNTN